MIAAAAPAAARPPPSPDHPQGHKSALCIHRAIVIAIDGNVVVIVAVILLAHTK
jgi:hypothetical protein